MPKKTPQDKKSLPEKRNKSAFRAPGARWRGRAQSLDSIMKKQGWLHDLERKLGAQRQWLGWVAEGPPAERRGPPGSAVPKGPALPRAPPSGGLSRPARF